MALTVMPEIILGPPGTGKTTTLINIVQEELESDTHPDRIAYLSFTRRAAEEAQDRAMEKFGYKRSDLPWFRTLHSLCFRLMGLTSSQVLEGKRLEEFGNVIGYKITGKFSLEDGTIFGFEKGDRLLFMDNLARVRGRPLREVYDEDDDELSFREVERFSRALTAFKADLGVMDFTDMLQEFIRSKQTLPIDVLLIDEAQDLSLLQWEVVWQLASTARRVVIAGDDDQAIYRWAGADVETLVDMKGNVRVLSQSWRVPKTVQALASDVVSRIKHRRPKVWSPRDDDGSVAWKTSFDSVDLSRSDILVLGRNRYLLKEIEQSIRAQGYLYEFQGARSIRPSVLDAVLTWERLRQRKPGVSLKNCTKMYDFMSVGKSVKRGFKTLPGLPDEPDVRIESLVENGGLLVNPEAFWYDALDKLSLIDVAYIRAALRRGENLLAPPRIRLSTIHGMKGGEATDVVLLTDMAQRTHFEAQKWPEDEARVWYVAVTRARQNLHIVAPKSLRSYKL